MSRRPGAGWTRRHLSALAVGAVVAGAGACGDTDPGSLGRPDDGLLERPDLQEIVELQSRRDGQALMGLLDAPDAAVRARAAFALGSVQAGYARPALEAALSDPLAPVRADAAFALGQLADSAVGPALLEALEGEETMEVRRELWEALGKAGDSATLAAVDVGAIGGDEAPAAALALARFGMRGLHDEEAVRWLGESLTAPDAELRRNAAYYFGRVPDPGVWTSQVRRIREALAAYDRDDPAAIHLLLALGKLGRPIDAERMVTWLREGEDWRVRAAAARAIGIRMALPPPIWEALLAALDDPSTHVAVSAAETMATSLQPMERAAEDMKSWIDAHPEKWRVAGPLLRSLTLHREADYVTGWLDRWSPADVGPWTVWIEALALLRGEGVIERLVEGTRSPSHRVAGAAVEALVRRWEAERFIRSSQRTYYEAFRRALESRDVRTAVAVAPVLADSIFRPFGAVEILVRAYRRMEMPGDVEAMVAVLEALGETGDPAADPVLREATDHPHAVIRSAAREALEGSAVEETSRGGTSAAAGGEGEGPGEGADGSEPVDPSVARNDEGGRGDLIGSDVLAAAARPDWTLLREVGSHPRLVVETAKGRIVVEMDAEEAPVTVQTIARLAREGRLDGAPFHRVVPNFVIQGGDMERGDGFGAPGFAIPSEFTRIPFERGTIGMASAGKDTEGSQYFITHGREPHLDGSYTAFGRVVEGQAVVDRIQEGDEAVRVTVEPGG